MKKDMSTIKEIIEVVGKSQLTELTIEEKGFKLFIKKPKLVEAPEVEEVEVLEEAVETVSEDICEIKSKTVGKFYSIDKNQDNMVKVGDKIKKGQIIGFVEAIGIKNNIISPVDGIVKEVLIANEELAEYGKVFVRIVK